MRRPFQCNRESKFEWHVEARSSRSILIELYPGKIVNGISRLTNEREDSVKAALPEGNFQGCARGEAEGADAYDVGEEKILKFRIVGNVEKDRFPNARCCGAPKLLSWFSCHCGSYDDQPSFPFHWFGSRFPQSWDLCGSSPVLPG